MSKKVLVIDGDDRGHFFLAIDGATMTIGDSPAHAEMVLRDLHISRIRCEVEVEEDLVRVRDLGRAPGSPDSAAAAPKELHAGEALHIGHSHLRLETAPGDEPAANVLPDTLDDLPGLAEEAAAGLSPAASGPAEPAPATRVAKQFVVIDGADTGRTFPIPEQGTVTVGKSAKHADVVLHDLYVARIHCEMDVEGETILVKHVEGQGGTLINGQIITKPKELLVGDVLRVGNSHLRLDTVVLEDSPAADQGEGGAEEAGEGEYEVVEEAPAEETAPPASAAEAPPLPKAVGRKEPVQAPQESVDALLKLEGQVFGHYKLEALLGRGPVGLVFRAKDQKHNQPVVVKVLSTDFPANQGELQHFIGVMKAVPHLHHNNLVTLHGVGRTGAYCWIAREFVDGDNVDRVLQRLNDSGKFTWSRACRLTLYLGRLLQYLHQHKVVHGNLTPRNIMIRTSDKLTKVTDLMLAQALEGSRLGKSLRAHELLAELPYQAPEQIEPGAVPDPFADLYAVGAVAYALLTGRPPFRGDTAEEIRKQIRQGKLVKPSKLQEGILRPFEEVVLKLLAKFPEDRYQNAYELLADVEPIVNDHGVKV